MSISFSHRWLENLAFEAAVHGMHPEQVKDKEHAMRIELRSGAVKLGPNQTLKVVDGAGSTVCAVEGSVWITEENQARDIVLQAGGAAPSSYRLRSRGVAIINSLGGAAAVSFA